MVLISVRQGRRGRGRNWVEAGKVGRGVRAPVMVLTGKINIKYFKSRWKTTFSSKGENLWKSYPL